MKHTYLQLHLGWDPFFLIQILNNQIWGEYFGPYKMGPQIGWGECGTVFVVVVVVVVVALVVAFFKFVLLCILITKMFGAVSNFAPTANASLASPYPGPGREVVHELAYKWRMCHSRIGICYGGLSIFYNFKIWFLPVELEQKNWVKKPLIV